MATYEQNNLIRRVDIRQNFGEPANIAKLMVADFDKNFILSIRFECM